MIAGCIVVDQLREFTFRMIRCWYGAVRIVIWALMTRPRGKFLRDKVTARRRSTSLHVSGALDIERVGTYSYPQRHVHSHSLHITQ